MGPIAHGNALLSVAAVKEIRELKGHLSSRDTAELFNVGKKTVLDIWSGRTWRNV